MSTMVPMYGFGGGGGKGASLTVNAPSGCTVTVSKDGKTKTKVAGADGVAVFRGLATGQWTVNMTNGVQTAPAKTADITADYAITMSFFAATIHVTYPVGSTCTATDGTTALTAPDTSGTWDCVVPNAGTWTVSLDSGFSEFVTISENGETQTLDKWYLYNHGNEHTDLTGGWLLAWGGNFGSGNLTFDTDKMVLDNLVNIDYLRVRTKKKINLAGGNRLNLNFTAANGGDNYWNISINIGADNVAVDIPSYVASASWTDRVVGTTKTISVPIPNDITSEYVTIGTIGISLFYVNEVWVD